MGDGGIVPPFLTSTLDGGEWSASTPGEIAPGTHWIGGWVSPRAGLGVVKKKSYPCRDSNSGRPAYINVMQLRIALIPSAGQYFLVAFQMNSETASFTCDKIKGSVPYYHFFSFYMTVTFTLLPFRF
jgi:hypothetical protein